MKKKAEHARLRRLMARKPISAKLYREIEELGYVAGVHAMRRQLLLALDAYKAALLAGQTAAFKVLVDITKQPPKPVAPEDIRPEHPRRPSMKILGRLNKRFSLAELVKAEPQGPVFGASLSSPSAAPPRLHCLAHNSFHMSCESCRRSSPRTSHADVIVASLSQGERLLYRLLKAHSYDENITQASILGYMRYHKKSHGFNDFGVKEILENLWKAGIIIRMPGPPLSYFLSQGYR